MNTPTPGNGDPVPSDRVKMLPRDLRPGMHAVLWVDHNRYDCDYLQPCLVTNVQKVKRDGMTKYAVRITEAITGRTSTRYLPPQRRVEVQL